MLLEVALQVNQLLRGQVEEEMLLQGFQVEPVNDLFDPWDPSPEPLGESGREALGLILIVRLDHNNRPIWVAKGLVVVLLKLSEPPPQGRQSGARRGETQPLNRHLNRQQGQKKR